MTTNRAQAKHTARCFWNVADAATEDYMAENGIKYLDDLTDADQSRIVEWADLLLDSDDYCTCTDG